MPTAESVTSPSRETIIVSTSWNELVSTFCSAISMYVFLGMVALTFLDVVLRTTIDRPISGTIEITELLMVVMFFGP